MTFNAHKLWTHVTLATVYSYTFLRSVVCLSVCLSSVTFVHSA